MSFAREKRLLLGWLALLVPIPLPFNQVLEWPALFVYLLLVIRFLQLAERGHEKWLTNRTLNVLGLIYFPLLALDLNWALSDGSAVKALNHLILFLLVVKLYSCRREQDKWHVLVAEFFVFLAAMATSSHVTIGIYLLAFLVTVMVVLARLAFLHVAAGFGEQQARAAPLPLRSPITAVTVLVLLVTVPIFAVMPRLREPFILGRGSGTTSMARTTGFSDQVNLSLTSKIRANRDVALRIQYADGSRSAGAGGDMRFKAATYDVYKDRNWFRLLDHVERLEPSPEQVFELVAEEASARAQVYLEPLGSISLPLPMEAQAVKLARRLIAVGLDPGGAVLLPGLPPRQTIRYEVEVARGAAFAARLAEDPEHPLAALDSSGVTPRMGELAAEVMGEGTTEQRVDRLERYLLTQLTYTVDFVGRDGENPLEDFLFVYKSGHCEYFASAMVLMLRSQGVPARFVTGFLGAEHNPLEDYFVVRQQNAHAWVEAHTPGRGWRVYDPTPPDGRPALAEQNLSLLLTQVWDYVNFRWDRYVLTYGADDQWKFFRNLRERVTEWWKNLVDWVKQEEPQAPPAGPMAFETDLPETAPARPVWQPGWPSALALTLFFGLLSAFLWWDRASPLSGAAAYRRLRRSFAHAGMEISDHLAPLDLEQQAASRYPAAAAPLRRLTALYLRESFAEKQLSAPERQGARQALMAVLAAVHRAEKRRSKTVEPAAA